MAFDDNGNLYVTHADSGTIWKITPSGAPVNLQAAFSLLTLLHGEAARPTATISMSAKDQCTKLIWLVIKRLSQIKAVTRSMTIDRTGNYGGYLYLATGCSDDIIK